MTQKMVILPQSESAKNATHREIVEIFLMRFRDKGFLGQQMKTLDAIEKTASLTGQCELKVSFILVENGLRAGRKAFPQSFLDHVDNVFFGHHKGQDILACAVYAALKENWHMEDEARVDINTEAGFLGVLNEEGQISLGITNK